MPSQRAGPTKLSPAPNLSIDFSLKLLEYEPFMPRTLPASWSYNPGPGLNKGFEDDLTCTATPDHLLLAVTDEHAVGSYNSTFTGEVKLDWDNAVLLALWIIQHAPEEAA